MPHTDGTAGNSTPGSSWEDEDSAHFIDAGGIYTPRREELAGVFYDLVEPANAWGRRQMADAWNAEVERQSRAILPAVRR